eukprot:GGOE01002382.1.p1 GENE.GGOE01002382.1~~GGOE01002382.1.p1  ORF type:complete len:726 (-),score=187.34 GGOE01002382.1:330-2507(-)
MTENVAVEEFQCSLEVSPPSGEEGVPLLKVEVEVEGPAQRRSYRAIAAKVQAKAKLENSHRKEVREHQKTLARLEEKRKELANVLSQSFNDVTHLSLLEQQLKLAEEHQAEEQQFQQLCNQRKAEVEALSLDVEELRLWRGFKALKEETRGLKPSSRQPSGLGHLRHNRSVDWGSSMLPQDLEERLNASLMAVAEELEEVHRRLEESPTSATRQRLLACKSHLMVTRAKVHEEYTAAMQVSVHEAKERQAIMEREVLRRACWKEEQRPKEEEMWRFQEREYRRRHRELEHRSEELSQTLQGCMSSEAGRLQMMKEQMEVLESMATLATQQRRAEVQFLARLEKLHLTAEENRLLRGRMAFTAKRSRSLSSVADPEEPLQASPTDVSPILSEPHSLTSSSHQKEKALLRRAREKKEQAEAATEGWENLEKAFRSKMRSLVRQLAEVEKQLNDQAITPNRQLAFKEQQLSLTTTKQSEEDAHEAARDRHLAELRGLQLDGEERRVWRGAEARLRMNGADGVRGAAEIPMHRRPSSPEIPPSGCWQCLPSKSLSTQHRLASSPLDPRRLLKAEGWPMEDSCGPSGKAAFQPSSEPNQQPNHHISLVLQFRDMSTGERAKVLKELDVKVSRAQTDAERIVLLSRKLKLLQTAQRARREGKAAAAEKVSRRLASSSSRPPPLVHCRRSPRGGGTLSDASLAMDLKGSLLVCGASESGFTLPDILHGRSCH